MRACCLQNASLSVMTQTQIWSMHSFASTDSLWGEDGDTLGPLDEDVPQPPETWLMLEFCDRGSLLVRPGPGCDASVRDMRRYIMRRPKALLALQFCGMSVTGLQV